MTSIAFIGAGRLGSALASALARRGVEVTAVASRDPRSAERLAATLPGCRAVAACDAAGAELVFLTVPDDAIAAVAASLPWRAGQSVVHCSGATEVSVLQPAAARGAGIGGFHPLQIFSDPAQATALLAGSSVAIEGPPPLEARLQQLAGVLGMRPLHLPPGSRALYHGGASFAASCLLSLLQEAVAVWHSFGIDEAEALAALLPLARGTLAAAASKGLAGALSGPLSRGDAGVIARHLEALDGLGAEHGRFYRELSRRQLQLARASGRLDDERLAALESLLRTAAARP